MRLEERIVLDGAALTTLEHGTTPLTDTTPLAEPDASAHAPAEGARDLKKSSDAEQGSSTSSQPETKEPKNTEKKKDSLPPSASESAEQAEIAETTEETTVVQPAKTFPVQESAPDTSVHSSAQPSDQSVDQSADEITLLVTASGLPDAKELVNAAADDVVTVSYDEHDSLETILEKITSSLGGKKADSIGDLASLAGDSTMTEFWKNIGALTKESGSIDLMGCSIAKGEAGKEFINKLEEVSGRDIAASNDATGNGKDADWELEEGGVQLIGKYFNEEKIGSYSGEMEGDSITLKGKTLYDTDNDGYYEIDSAEKLIALSQDKTGWSGKDYELTADITFN